MTRGMTPVDDALGRPLRSLRISVTDRCNLRCAYCMPEDEYVWLPRDEILSFEEISALTDIFLSLGVDKLRLTGGEPLLRHDFAKLVRILAAKPGIRDLALTTNGVLLAEQAQSLANAGLRRITISLDTLLPDRFEQLSRRADLPRVLEGIEAARHAGLAIKINTVILRGANDDELPELLDWSRSIGAELRFIEYMDVGGATRWSRDAVVTKDEVLARLSDRFSNIDSITTRNRAPAERFALPDGTTFGIIASTTEPFCGDCDRSRLTADGRWYTCLYSLAGLDLKSPLRAGASPYKLQDAILNAWRGRTDRGAEDRLTQRERGPFVPLTALRRDVHLEMHTRGG